MQGISGVSAAESDEYQGGELPRVLTMVANSARTADPLSIKQKVRNLPSFHDHSF